MAIKKILYYPDPELMEKCQPVGDDFGGIEALYVNLCDTMFAANGAGLAAPQIGLLKCVFIVDPLIAGLTEKEGPLIFVDPEIVDVSAEMELADEGCLSFPGIYVPVTRHYAVTTRAKNIAGEIFEIKGDALFARAMQHEIDHLSGRLLTEFVGRLKKKMIRRKMLRESEPQA